MADAPPSGGSSGWAAAHKRLVAVLGTVALILGVATGVLTLRDQLSSRSNEPAEKGTSSPGGMVTAANAAQLSDDVQLGRFEQLLGEPVSQKRLQNDEWLVSTWESPDIAVNAFSNRDSQVVAFTLTSLGPGFTPPWLSMFVAVFDCAPRCSPRFRTIQRA